MDSFSRRHGFNRPDAEITVRHEAPQELRDAVPAIAYRCGLKPVEMRQVACGLLFKSPDPSNWSDPNIEREVQSLMQDFEWFEVYDLIEQLAEVCVRRGFNFDGETNRMFRIKGIGWQLMGGRLEIRGSEAFELALTDSHAELAKRGNYTAAGELHEAIQDLSRRPNPEVSGAIQHAMAALECLARDVCGSKDTLGDLLNRNQNLFPKPVDQIVSKAWGYTSNHGRHLIEGRAPAFDEAELVVGLSGVLVRYLSRRFPKL